MLIPRILAAACVVMYLLAMCLPAVVAKGYHTTYLLHGWEVTYMCAILSFAPSMNLVEKASFIVGTLSNVLFLFGIAQFLGREFWHWPRPRLRCYLLDFGSVSHFLNSIRFNRWHVAI
jgi:hypothetical protein